ncbi:amino acid adenylation domain-containing protein, partial [Pseudoalteromonas sp. MMG007]|uniref:non-ribosomal peptide synthetase n=1 Tax=Pseudoalteromonas sp. MMG007 TaxID=2822684 RepID=UPI001FFD08C0
MLLDAYKHQQVPFEKLVEELQPARSQSYSPLFQVMLTLQSENTEELILPNLTLKGISSEERVSKFDLTLNVREISSGLALSWDYGVELFTPETIHKFVYHFAILLKNMVSTPEISVNQLPLFDEEEQQDVLNLWKDTTQAFPELLTLHELFEQQVKSGPEEIAINFNGEHITYSELNNRANQLAHCLQEKYQVRSEGLVGVCIERSVDMVVGLLGILKAGAAYVPLDPNYPLSRLKYIIEDAKLDIIVTQGRLNTRLNFPESSSVLVDDLASLNDYSTANLDSVKLGITSSNLAYIIYTSGSTGKPKGVMIEHRNAVSLVCWAEDNFKAEELSNVLASTSISFDLSVFELFVPLCTGHSITLVNSILDIQQSEEYKTVSMINTVPSAIKSLLDTGAVKDYIKCVNLAGEPLAQEIVERLYDIGVDRVFDLYGPSEDTTYSTYAHRQKGALPTIGRPIANTRARVLDPGGQLVPLGVAGELYLGGAGLSRGYLNQAILTEEKFVADPFIPGERLFRTGDLVRCMPDGQLEYIGRMDYQVKVRGFRIELGEIEKVLASHQDVDDALVMAHDYGVGDKRLVAYVASEKKFTLRDLHELLAVSLPEYMVPSAIVCLSSFPLTANGKIDRLALPFPDMSLMQEHYVAPTTPSEQLLCEIWSSLLGLE